MTPLRFTMAATAAGLLLLSALRAISSGLPQMPTMAVPVVLANVGMTALIYRWVSSAPEHFSFSQRYLLSLVAKILMQLVVMAGAGLADPPSLVATAVFALVCHVVFLLLEVFALYKKVRG